MIVWIINNSLKSDEERDDNLRWKKTRNQWKAADEGQVLTINIRSYFTQLTLPSSYRKVIPYCNTLGDEEERTVKHDGPFSVLSLYPYSFSLLTVLSQTLTSSIFSHSSKFRRSKINLSSKLIFAIRRNYDWFCSSFSSARLHPSSDVREWITHLEKGTRALRRRRGVCIDDSFDHHQFLNVN